MENYNETNQDLNTDKVDKEAQAEDVVWEEIRKKTVDTIVDLVNQANAISSNNTSIEPPKEYEVETAETYIDKTDEKSSEARQKYNDLKGMKESHFYTIGRNKAKIEKTQDVLIYVIDAIDNNANATKALFNKLTKMTEFSQKLYGIGLMGIASNRIVVREIKLRLENASKEELSKLARQELESVLTELKRQQFLEIRVDQIETKLDETLENHKQLTVLVKDNQTEVLNRIDATDGIVERNQQQLEAKLNEANEKHEQLERLVDKNYISLMSTSSAYDKRIESLEKKSFIDSSVYKVLVGLAALGALILSVISFFL